jgi:hypothetical protein
MSYFGKSTDTVPQPSNFLGQAGWYQVPCGWFARQNADGTISASPNSDFSKPVYDVKVDQDGYMKFYSCMFDAMARV